MKYKNQRSLPSKYNLLIDTVPGCGHPSFIDQSSATPVRGGETKEGSSAHGDLDNIDQLITDELSEIVPD